MDFEPFLKLINRTYNMNTLDILETLIAFDTVSSKSNLDLIAWVEKYLVAHNVNSTRVTNETGDKASLYAIVGPADKPGYVLSGHTDVVPVAGQDWKTDPFQLHVEGGFAYGRGACDMKGFLACVLAAVPAMQNAKLETPLIIAFSYDEEVGCTGVRPLLSEMAQWPIQPLGCFVGEPTSMSVVVGHKEKLSKRVVVHGLTGHSALAPLAVNAAHYGARLVAFVSELAEKLKLQGCRDDLYDVAHSTAHVGRFVSGTQLNIVPAHAEFDFEFRTVAGDDITALFAEFESKAADLEAEMRSVYPQASIEIRPYSEIPGLDTPIDSDVVTLAKHLAGKNSHAKVAFSTEAGLFQQMAGVSTVVCGPGSIEQAHKADEYIAVEQLAACDHMLLDLVKHCSKER